MTGKDRTPSVAALRALEATLHIHRRAEAARAAHDRPAAEPVWKRRLTIVRRRALSWLRLELRRPFVRKLMIACLVVLSILAAGTGALWWRLSDGPIAFDLATPWLAAAIEENFGADHTVEVGGTVLERDEAGRTALRIRDIVVHDADGTVVANAPRAEVGISGTSLLTGRLRAESLNLVGAKILLRIERNGEVVVFAGANKRPLTTAPAIVDAAPAVAAVPAVTAADKSGQPAASAAPPAHPGVENLVALVRWIDGLGAVGLDGRDLAVIGLKNGILDIDDQRIGKNWEFQKINMSLSRPRGGGVMLSIGSEENTSGNEPWSLTAAVAATDEGRHAINLEARKVPAKDFFQALRVGEGEFEASVPLSASIRADIAADGRPLSIKGKILAEAGYIGPPLDPNAGIEALDARMPIDRAEINLDWDAARSSLIVPFQVLSGANHITLLAQMEMPDDAKANWHFSLTGGTIVLGSSVADEDPLTLNRVAVRARIDPVKKRIELEQGNLSSKDVRLALSGGVDYSGADPRLTMGVAGNKMSVSVMKRIWPPFINPAVRSWVFDRILSGTVEKFVIATNAPMTTMRSGGPPIPDDGLSIEIVGTGAAIHPVDGLPVITGVDLVAKVTGRTATVALDHGIVELSPGHRLTMTNGVFEVPDTYPKKPPARVRFHVEGGVPAAAELLGLDRLRDSADAAMPIDSSASRGTLTGQVVLGMPLGNQISKDSTNYNINLDLANFTADKMVMGQKVEASALKIAANNQGYQIKGDIKINGLPAQLDYRKGQDDRDADVRLQATLDDSARGRLGIDFGNAISGNIPIKLSGRVSHDKDQDTKLAVEADLTPAKIDNLLPGWSKPAGKPVHAAFTLSKDSGGTHFDDLAIDGSGVSVKGGLQVDGSNNVVSANFPVFSLTDGDKATLKADRSADGALRVTIRGDVYDGRGFVKSALNGSVDHKGKKHGSDVDLDIKLGAVAGFHGEALRGLDLRMSRRGGKIRTFVLNGKLGRDMPLLGDIRRSNSTGRPVIYFETNDAGALFRFTDIYPKIGGGQMWVAMDLPTGDATPQDGLLNVRNFSIRGESALDRIVANGEGGSRNGIDFARMRVEFTRTPGRLNVRDGVVSGQTIGATIDGQLDYAQNEVRMRGTFVPLYGLNNIFGQIPIVGLFLGGSNEGLLGITYEVVGQPSAPVLRVNPISAVAPGLLRKLFEFPNSNDRLPGTDAFANPSQR